MVGCCFRPGPTSVSITRDGPAPQRAPGRPVRYGVEVMTRSLLLRRRSGSSTSRTASLRVRCVRRPSPTSTRQTRRSPTSARSRSRAACRSSATALPPIDLPRPTWPSAVITQAPRWLSTDLRDGSQALIDPMTPARKMKMFELLVKMGYKEIEVGFPSASETDFAFVRQLIEGDHIPDDVTISVLTQAREDLIERSVQSLVGVPRANIHLYNALAPCSRRVVFRASRTRSGHRRPRDRDGHEARRRLPRHDRHRLRVQPEIFTSTELPFSVEVSRRSPTSGSRGRPRDHPQPARHRRGRDAQRVRRPDRVVRAPADRRQNTVISLHPHSDRGTAVAATEGWR